VAEVGGGLLNLAAVPLVVHVLLPVVARSWLAPGGKPSTASMPRQTERNSATCTGKGERWRRSTSPCWPSTHASTQRA
jgi:hypothetical protein